MHIFINFIKTTFQNDRNERNEVNETEFILDLISLVASICGIVLNLISALILSNKTFKTKYARYFRAYSINCIIYHIVYSIQITFEIIRNRSNFKEQFDYEYLYNALSSLRVILSTFCGYLDTFIVYETIQLFNPKFKFIIKTGVKKTLIILFIFTLLTCSPLLVKINFSRETFIQTVTFEVFFLIAETFRNIISGVTIDIVVNVILYKTFKKFTRKKMSLASFERSRHCLTHKNSFMKSDIDNTKVGIITCLTSFLKRCFDFTLNGVDLLIGIRKNKPTIYDRTRASINLFYSLRIMMNFFVFYFLNRKFSKIVRKKLSRIKFLNRN